MAFLFLNSTGAFNNFEQLALKIQDIAFGDGGIELT
jgi:hypothetical protein